uniref:Replication protein A subunit n=1 Tax=Tetradesmus obliquus TaxID=3088 RepID=A0A383VJ14_TETOB
METLTPKALELAKDGQTEPVNLRVRDVVKLPNGKFYSCTLTDGTQTMKGRLVAAVNKALADGSLQLGDGDVVRLENYVCNKVGDDQLLMVSSLQLLHKSSSSSNTAATDAAGAKPDQQLPGTPVVVKQEIKQEEQVTPAAAAARPMMTPGPTPSPSEEMKASAMMLTPQSVAGSAKPSYTPQAPHSASPLPVGTKSGVQPIAALNPYDTNWTIKAKLVRKAPPRASAACLFHSYTLPSLLLLLLLLLPQWTIKAKLWTIKAKLVRKAPPRAFNSRAGTPSRVFNVELADAAGSQIQATFWREAAEKYLDVLQEGKVYYFSKFQVKVANKQYATVRNDYELHFDNRTEVEEAADQGGIDGAAQVELVPLDKLPRFVGRKMPVDVLGVVTHCGPLGTIKRKADNSELPRRDVTIADSSRCSVVLTLWADQASRAELDGCEGQLLQVTCVRVGDYNGCSLSAVTRSQVSVNPESAAADALREWWQAEGSSAALTPLGQASAAGGAGGGPRNNKLQFLSDVMVEEDIPSPDAKPTYHDVVVSVVQVQDSQTMYYLANPENGKKVEPREGRFWCEAESRYVDAAQNRYVLTARVADATRETYVNMFNDQGVQLLGASADELAAQRGADEASFAGTLAGAKWSEWLMTLAARSREYNGERRMRYTVVRMAPVDYAQEGHRLLQLIQGKA